TAGTQLPIRPAQSGSCPLPVAAVLCLLVPSTPSNSNVPVYFPASVLNDGRDLLTRSGLGNRLQFFSHQCHQIVELLLKRVAVAIRAASDPQQALPCLAVTNRYRPKPHVHHVEYEGQSNA